MVRWMGLDIGERRIGVALSDPLEITAQAHIVRQRESFSKDINFFVNLIKEFDVSGVVLGLPVNMNGTRGPMAEKVLRFGEALEEASGIKMVYWDERLTTASAERLLIEADLRREHRRQKVDKVAAAIILQNFLDSRSRMNSPL